MLQAMVFVLSMVLLGALIIFVLDWLVHNTPTAIMPLGAVAFLILYKLYGGKNNG